MLSATFDLTGARKEGSNAERGDPRRGWLRINRKGGIAPAPFLTEIGTMLPTSQAKTYYRTDSLRDFLGIFVHRNNRDARSAGRVPLIRRFAEAVALNGDAGFQGYRRQPASAVGRLLWNLIAILCGKGGAAVDSYVLAGWIHPLKAAPTGQRASLGS